MVVGSNGQQEAQGGVLAGDRRLVGEWLWCIEEGRETAPLSVTVLALNLLGDGLRDAMDPRLKGAATPG